MQPLYPHDAESHRDLAPQLRLWYLYRHSASWRCRPCPGSLYKAIWRTLHPSIGFRVRAEVGLQVRGHSRVVVVVGREGEARLYNIKPVTGPGIKIGMQPGIGWAVR